ncbi:MAG: transketolase family protein [Christensenellales bacterium]|jgi:transketolase
MYKVAKENGRDPVEMKAAYADIMIELAEKNPQVVDVEADLANTLNMNKFKKRFPNRFFDIGVAEQSLSSISAGLSVVGKIPFAHSFACFASRRMCDQNYLSIAYAKTNVKIVGSDPAISGAMNGGTHQANEDLAIMRSIPNITIVEPSDITMLKWAINHAADTYGVFYIRVQRAENIVVYEEGSTFEIGKANLIREGKDVTLIVAGSLMMDESLKAAALLEKDGISARIVDMFTIKPIDADCILRCAQETGAIVTVENHNIIGGLGSAVAEVLAENGACAALKRIGVPDRVGEVGTSSELKVVMGMRAEDIADAAKLVISKKK